MPSTPVCAHISQPSNVLHNLPSQIILQRHRTQFRDDSVYLSIVQHAHIRSLVDRESRHQLCADLRAYAVEGLECFRDQTAFGEVGAEDEDLCAVSGCERIYGRLVITIVIAAISML